MSDDADHESKTEEPSERKTKEAHDKGDTPHSREFAIAGAVLGIAASLTFLRSGQPGEATGLLASLIDHAGDVRFRAGADASRLAWTLAVQFGAILAAPIAVLAAFTLAGALGQGVPRMVVRRITPDFSRISPKAGLGRLFSRRGAMDFLRSALKMTAVAAAACAALRASYADLISAAWATPTRFLDLFVALTQRIAWSVLAVVATLAVIDLVVVRLRWRKKLMMTRQELKDEFKQSEGDPLVKSRLRSAALARARQRMMDNVPKATMVLVNPTHYAVALRYVHGESGAPTVIAKGKELMAMKIRTRAEECGVPVIENPPLVRAMYDHVEIEKMIPPEFYRAIAEIINYLQTRKPR
jgi:flagellar biosynthesis protein FlhB